MTSRPMRVWVVGLALLLAATVGMSARAQEKTEKKEEAKKEEKKDGLPLKPERTVEFTTDEGTWLSLDVSPDGQALVFELLGDLYTLPIAGGDAKALSTGMAFDSMPRSSPDGKWIAFVSDRDGADNLWIMRADGSDPKKLSDEKGAEFASPTWTPDSQYVIVSKSTWGLRTYELWEYHVQGGSGVRITKAKPRDDTPFADRHNALGAVFSPDGRYLYYARKQGGFQYNLNFPQWQVARRDMITGDEDILTQDLGSAIRPLVSPDGAWLVYGTRHETQTGLRLRNLKTGEDRWLKYPVQRDDQESRFTRDTLPGYAFMPDGKEIVLTFGGKLQRLSIANGEAREIPFTANIKQELGPRLNFPKRVEEGPVRVRILQDPSQSPDGKRLAFSALTKIYMMDIPGGSPRRLTTGDAREFQPAWSPDGQWLAYVTWSDDGGHLWKAPADGSPDASGPQQLTTVSAFYADPVWSPDGAKIVALRGSAYERLVRPFDFGQVRGMDLIWVPAAGGDANLIIPARGRGKPHFARDPNRVYVYSNDGLLSLRLDGTDRRDHLKVTGPGAYNAERPVPADDIRVSPDGRWAMTLASNHLYVLAIPPVGGAAPEVDISKAAVPIKKLTDIGADYFLWADDGKTLTWAVGPSFFRQAFDTVKFEKPKKEEKKDEAKDGEAKEAKKEEKPKPEYQEIAVVLELPRHKPSGTVVLRGARVITMKGDEVIDNADLVVTDNRITAVGRRGRVTLPAGARTFDLRGKTILPGFLDTHAHWFEIRRGILDTQNWSFLANLAYGVTGGLDVQTGTNDMFAYQDLVETGGALGLRAYNTGPGIFSDNAFKSLDEAKGVLTKYKTYYRTGNLKSYLVGNRQQRQWVVQASKELELMPTTEGALDLKLDLTHAIDGFTGNEHSLPIVPLYKDVVEFIAQSGSFYTPTLLVNYGGPWAENFYYTSTEVHDDARLSRFTPHNLLDQKTKRRPWFRRDEYAYPQTAASATKVIRAGGRVGIGSHGQLQGLGYHWELWSLAEGGLTPLEALRAATLHGAEIIGYAQDLGSLEPGKLADLIVLDKNPLEDIHNTNSVRYVMINGELFEAETLKQVWPVEKELAPLWWWNAGPENK